MSVEADEDPSAAESAVNLVGQQSLVFGTLISVLGGALTIANHVTDPFQVESNLVTYLVSSIIIIGTAFLVAVVAIMRLWTRLNKYGGQIEKLKNRIETLDSEGYDGLLYGIAFSVFLYDDDRVFDQRHDYEYQEWIFDLTEDDPTYKTILWGKTRGESEKITIKLTGDVDYDLDDMGFEVSQFEDEDDDEGTELDPVPREENNTKGIIIDIPFEEPLDSGEKFYLEYTCQSLGEYNEKDVKYGYVPAHRFRRRLDHLNISVILPDGEYEANAFRIDPDDGMNPSEFEVPSEMGEDPLRLTPLEADDVTQERECVEYRFKDGNADSLYLLKSK